MKKPNHISSWLKQSIAFCDIKPAKLLLKPVSVLLYSFILLSCVNERINELDSEPLPSDKGEVTGEKFYASIHINLVGSIEETRASWDSQDDEATNYFDKGLNAERAIYIPSGEEMNHFIIIFDKKGNKVLGWSPIMMEEASDESHKDYTSYKTATIEISGDELKSYTESDFPDMKVLCILNASQDLINSIIQSEESFTYSSITKTIIDDEKFFYFTFTNPESKASTKYFVMTSSMVVDKSQIVPGKDSDVKFKFFKTKEEAEKNPFSIYVERLKAKYTVIFKNDNSYYYLTDSGNSSNISPSADANNPSPINHLVYSPKTKLKVVTSYTRSNSIDKRNEVNIEEKDWKVSIIGWNINGLEKEEYLFKNINPKTSYYNGWDTWESTSYPYRNFWAEDPHYAEGKYPDQFRKADRISSYEDMKSPTLTYYKFTELSKKDLRQYITENTFSKETLGEDAYNNGAALRVGSHLIVTAQLLIQDLDDERIYKTESFDSETNLVTDMLGRTASSKLLMNNYIWGVEAYKEYVAEYLGYHMLSEANTKSIGYNDGKFYVEDNERFRVATAKDFDLKSAHIKGGDGYVYLIPSEGTTLFRKDENAYLEITDEQFEALVLQYPELMAGHFNEGRMYYAKESVHNERKDASEVETGDYGTVRNNWYAYTITEITSPGEPVDNPDQKIIPNNLREGGALGAIIKVLDWHKIYTSVDVSNQHRPGPSD